MTANFYNSNYGGAQARSQFLLQNPIADPNALSPAVEAVVNQILGSITVDANSMAFNLYNMGTLDADEQQELWLALTRRQFTVVQPNPLGTDAFIRVSWGEA